MINWLMQQSILLSLVCALILLCHKPLLKQLGAHHMYSLWLAIPFMIFGSLVLQFLPNLLAESKVASFEYYRVLASLAVKDNDSLVSTPLLVSLWAVGIAVMAILLLIQHSYLKRILRSSKPFKQEENHGVLGKQLLPSLFTKTLPIMQSPNISSPMLTGVLTPKIIVPADFHKLSSSQQESVVAHELYHHERGDIITNLLAYTLLAIFWFNPLSWLAYRRFRDDQELACDAQITSAMNTHDKIAYSHALLAYSQHAQMGMLHTHYGNKNILKERIMQMKKQHGKSTLALIGMTLSLGLASLVLNQQVQAGDHQASLNESAKMHAKGIHPLTRVEPKYPIAAVKANQNGYVQLKFDISKSGRVSNITVIKSSPTGIFDKSAVEALTQWVYNESKQGAKGSQVQLDYVIDEPTANLERIKVTAH
ncbi:M56 family metallopeptidase [Shewanella violacea]|nr:M56 family metallopeptidase [Shewanella violacea]